MTSKKYSQYQDKHKILPNLKTLETSRYKHTLLAFFVREGSHKKLQKLQKQYNRRQDVVLGFCHSLKADMQEFQSATKRQEYSLWPVSKSYLYKTGIQQWNTLRSFHSLCPVIVRANFLLLALHRHSGFGLWNFSVMLNSFISATSQFWNMDFLSTESLRAQKTRSVKIFTPLTWIPSSFRSLTHPAKQQFV